MVLEDIDIDSLTVLKDEKAGRRDNLTMLKDEKAGSA